MFKPSTNQLMQTGLLLITLVLLPAVSALAQYDIEDNGDFLLDIREGRPEDVDMELAVWERATEIEDILYELNNNINLNNDIHIAFISWPEGEKPNAAYIKEERAIIISYGMIQEIVSLFNELGIDGEEDGVDILLMNVLHTLLHEAAHALIHVNDIEVFSDESEEEISDQLAFLILANYTDDVQHLGAVAAAYVFKDQQGGDNDVISEHLPDFDRGMDYLCWIVGTEPALLDDMDGEFYDLLSERDCVAELEYLNAEWEDRLDPSLKYE